MGRRAIILNGSLSGKNSHQVTAPSLHQQRAPEDGAHGHVGGEQESGGRARTPPGTLGKGARPWVSTRKAARPRTAQDVEGM